MSHSKFIQGLFDGDGPMSPSNSSTPSTTEFPGTDPMDQMGPWRDPQCNQWYNITNPESMIFKSFCYHRGATPDVHKTVLKAMAPMVRPELDYMSGAIIYMLRYPTEMQDAIEFYIADRSTIERLNEIFIRETTTELMLCAEDLPFLSCPYLQWVLACIHDTLAART